MTRSLPAVLLSCLFVLSACVTSRSAALEDDGSYAVAIAKELILQLPQRPGLDEPIEETQTIVGHYDGASRAFQAQLSGNASEVNVVMVAVAGPRIIAVDWTENGIEETRSTFAPEQLSGLNILADIFIVRWPEQSVRSALPAGTNLVTTNKERRIERDGEVVITVTYDALDENGRSMTRLTNHDRDYSLAIYTS
ncbi:DUF3261 domain-containing protein [Henriciella litoralis]|uniref:DUF3261 domain-containing protein n=1 Tax=Henriciella litoralis TaxID=568102 RepID=UPI0009FD68BE|nr:DUF3261 domain-containing protein [Henriciella litoralis]